MDYRKIRLKDVLSPKKWAIVADAYAKKFQGVSLELCEEVMMLHHMGDTDMAHNLAKSVGQSVKYCEVVVSRADACRPCVENGSCLHCGCSMPEAMFSMENECSEGKWKEVKI